jgi:hypothetical protein
MSDVRPFSVVVCAALAALTSACGADTDPPVPEPNRVPSSEAVPSAAPSGPRGDDAAWSLKPDQNLQVTSTVFTALVSRMDCNGGVTGRSWRRRSASPIRRSS